MSQASSEVVIPESNISLTLPLNFVLSNLWHTQPQPWPKDAHCLPQLQQQFHRSHAEHIGLHPDLSKQVTVGGLRQPLKTYYQLGGNTFLEVCDKAWGRERGWNHTVYMPPL